MNKEFNEGNVREIIEEFENIVLGAVYEEKPYMIEPVAKRLEAKKNNLISDISLLQCPKCKELQQFNNALTEQNDCLTKANRKLQGEIDKSNKNLDIALNQLPENIFKLAEVDKDKKIKGLEDTIKGLNEIIFVRDEEISNLRLEVRELQGDVGDLENKLRITEEHEEAIMGDYQDEHKKCKELQGEIKILKADAEMDN